MDEYLQLILLTVEFILLILTIFLLYLSRRELNERRRLVEHMIEMTRILTRAQYFNEVIDGIRNARNEIFGSITGAKPKESKAYFDKLLIELDRALKRGVKIRYLFPMDRDRLYVGYLYSQIGIEVRYHSGLVVYDLRHMVIDDYVVVLGFPEKTGYEQPTRVGIKIKSESLARIFRDRFEALWSEAIEYENYLNKVISEYVKANPDISPILISKELGVPIDEIKKHL